MYELYQKVQKSQDNLYGTRKIEKNENPFLDGACMLCWAAQDYLDKDVFGTVKIGMKMARIATKDKLYKLDDFPVNFLAIKSDKAFIER